LAEAGKVYLDFILSVKNGKARGHGFLWRISSDSIPDLYLETETVDLI
jgi:hypothetical protein